MISVKCIWLSDGPELNQVTQECNPYLLIDSRMRLIYSCALGNGFNLKFPQAYQNMTGPLSKISCNAGMR